MGTHLCIFAVLQRGTTFVTSRLLHWRTKSCLKESNSSSWVLFLKERICIWRSKFLSLKNDSLIFFMVSKINILTKFRWTICYTFIINCTNFEKMHGFSINMQ